MTEIIDTQETTRENWARISLHLLATKTVIDANDKFFNFVI